MFYTVFFVPLISSTPALPACERRFGCMGGAGAMGINFIQRGLCSCLLLPVQKVYILLQPLGLTSVSLSVGKSPTPASYNCRKE